MKVVISALHFGFFRNFESLVDELAARGHELLLLADEPEDLGGRALVERLAARWPAVRWGWAPVPEPEGWFRVARKVRQAIDYLRFLDPAFDPFPKLLARASDRVPRAMIAALRVPLVNTPRGRRALMSALDAIDRAMPIHVGMLALLAAERPDVALFTSVTNSRAPQIDHVRAAMAAGVPAGVCVYSWDHLSSKALIRVAPDRVFVWNDTQKREAVELHGLPPDRIVVTGAQVYDQWFDRQPSRTSEAFAIAMGLPPGRRLYLWVCSALTPDPGESRLVRRWIEEIRRSDDPEVRDAAILIRPHPERRKEWEGIRWPELGPVVIAGANPVTGDAKADYFDALAYSSAVVGLVTSAFLEAAIAGCPVMTILLPELDLHQRGMLHFRYLLEIEEGLLMVARSYGEHVEQLRALERDGDGQRARQQRFLRAFVRPRGLDRASTPVFADAVEALARTPVTSVKPAAPVWARWTALRLASSRNGLLRRLLEDGRQHAEQSARDALVGQHRRDRRQKWRQHRRRKLAMRTQWALKRVRDLIR
ncbi:MAG: hypothetical protein AB1635_00905 [Acidobacteriota bacterium]